MNPEHAWLRIQKLEGGTEQEALELTLTVGSFSNPLVITVDAGDWSQMLSNPGKPIDAHIVFRGES